MNILLKNYVCSINIDIWGGYANRKRIFLFGGSMGIASNKKWWKNSIVYQIYVDSFCDSNGDGIGDIPGIISKLHYLKDLGVDVILLSPIFVSPCLDKGYDISDFKGINPDYGTMEDMDRLISRAKRLGIKIIMDIAINCTSDEHEWFKKALAGDDKYKDYYYFRKSNGLFNPNNWHSFYGGSAWTKLENGEAYLHLLGEGQPDLNWDNPDVYNEFADIMRFWLDKGINGFRLDNVNIIYKNSLENGKFSPILAGKEHYLHTQGCEEILKKLRLEVWSNYKSFIVGETVLSSVDDIRLFCDESRGELDTAFFFGRMDADSKKVKRLRKHRNVGRLLRYVDKGQSSLEFPVNYLETGDDANYVKFFGNDQKNLLYFEKMLTGLNFSLKGIPFISEGKSCSNPNDLKDSESLPSFYAKMIEFRKNSKALAEGRYRRIASRNDVFIFTREAPEERLYVYCNFSIFNKEVEFYGDRIIFSNYDDLEMQESILKPFEFRIVVSNI